MSGLSSGTNQAVKFHTAAGASVTGTFTITTFFTKAADAPRRLLPRRQKRPRRAITMKLAKTSATVWAVLALSFTISSAAGAQSTPAKNTARKAKAASSKRPAPAASSADSPSAAANNEPGPAMKSDAVTAKRDPFEPLVSNTKPSHGPLPPGKAGLVIATVRVDGTVKSPSGMIAVVSNEERRFISFAKATSCTTGTWKRSDWTASRLERIRRTPLGNRSNEW